MATRFYSNVEYGNTGGRGSNDPDIIYYNACIVNNGITNGDPNGYPGAGSYEDTQVVFNDTRQTPILQNASEYNMSVIRFDLAGATKSLPLFVPRIVPGQEDINLTIYNIYMGVTFNGSPSVYPYKSAPIKWVPQYLTRNNVPATANPQQIFNTDYYFCDSYSWWCFLINGTVKQLYDDFLSDIGDSPSPPPGLAQLTNSEPPRIFYNPVTKLFSWSFDSAIWGQFATDAGASGFRFYLGLDTNLETLLTNFMINFNDVPNFYNFFTFPPQVNTLIITPQQIAIDTDPLTGQAYVNPNIGGHIRYVITQDYPSTSGNWSPIDSVIITSTKLPISQEIIAPAPGTFGSSDLGFNAGTTGAAFQQVIADIQVGETGADDWRQYMEYEPKAEYRVLSFNKSQEPIQNIDFLVWWRNRYDNNLYPLRLYNGSAVSIKVMFRRKGY